MQSISRRRVLGGLTALGAATAVGSLPRAAGAQDLQKVSIALDWYPNANHAGLYLAQERGYFTDAQ